jgi:hypothetical protein
MRKASNDRTTSLTSSLAIRRPTVRSTSCRLSGGKERNCFLSILQDFLPLNTIWAWYNYRLPYKQFPLVPGTVALVCLPLSMCYFAQENISWPFQPPFPVARQLILPYLGQISTDLRESCCYGYGELFVIFPPLHNVRVTRRSFTIIW